MIINFFGIIAFVTSFIGFFPQIYKAAKTRSTDDISMLMLINYLICSIAWIVYGAYTASAYVTVSNILGLVGCMMLMMMKHSYDKRSI